MWDEEMEEDGSRSEENPTPLLIALNSKIPKKVKN